MKTTARFAALVGVVTVLVAVGAVPAAGAVIGPTGGLPTSAQDCQQGGWRTFGVFKNQGDCVSFVATSGRNRPALEPLQIFAPPTYYPPAPSAFMTSGDF